jgi:hypothetical protein
MRVPIRRKKPTPVPSERQSVCEYPRYQGCTGTRFTDRTEPFGKAESGRQRSVAPPAQRASREVIGWLAIAGRARPVAQALCGAQDAFPGT